jgi:small subunit ribosomal protein S2
MALPTFTIKQLLEAGLHYGHQTRRWNPKMAPYIFGERNGIHIMDLQQTATMLSYALKVISDIVGNGGRVLFVGTKQQASEKIKDAAEKCGQYYINHRWLGGLLTNSKTVNQSIKRLRILENDLASPDGLTKKEILKLQRQYDKLNRAIGGIRDMGGLPDVLFVIDTNCERIAIQEANKLKIPVVAVVDSNSDPDGVNYKIPGNDDAIRAIQTCCDFVADAVLDGLSRQLASHGEDAGALEDPDNAAASLKKKRRK